MSGFKFDDDELNKLFAQAGDAVKKAARPAPAAPRDAEPPPPAPPSAAETQVEVRTESSAAPPPQEATPAPAAAPSSPPPAAGGAPVRLMGGEQEAAAFVGRTADGTTVRVPWGEMRALSVARVNERNHLGFVYRQTVYYFSDENVVYKGLLGTLAATLTLNWRMLVNEMSGQVADKSDAGIQAMTGGGGMVPRLLSLADFAKSLLSRA